MCNTASGSGRLRGWALGGLLLAGLAVGCGSPTPPPPAAPTGLDRTGFASRGPAAERLVLLVSVDGLAPRVLARAETPTLDRLAREGTRAEKAMTTVPSLTLPSHTSMLSGVGPERHKVLWNRWEGGFEIGVETVFTHCSRVGMRCGLFAAKEKFAHFARGEPGVERYGLAPRAEAVFEAALDYADEEQPHFVMVHVAEVDAAGHRFGWGSPEQRSAIEAIDAALGEFLEELLDEWEGRARILVTSDHGGSGLRHGGASPADIEIPWIAWGPGVPAGGTIPRVQTVDTAATVLSWLDVPVPADWLGKSRHPFYFEGEARDASEGDHP